MSGDQGSDGQHVRAYTVPDRAALARLDKAAASGALVREYQGATAPGMRQLARQYGVAYATVRARLLGAGVELRERGGAWRTRRAAGGDGSER